MSGWATRPTCQSYTLKISLQFAVRAHRNKADLAENVRSSLVHGVRDLLPGRDLLVIPDAGRVRPLGALPGDERALGEDEARAAAGANGTRLR